MRAPRTCGLLITIGMCWMPGVAAAGDVGCVWRALPEEARAAALSAYADDQADKIFGDVAEEVIGEAVIKCVAIPSNTKAADRMAETVGLALAGYAIQLGSEASLKQQLRIEPTALERAYGTIEPRRRRELAGLLESSKEPSNAVTQILLRAIQVAYPEGDLRALVDKPAFEQFYVYFAARAMREQAEAKF